MTATEINQLKGKLNAAYTRGFLDRTFVNPNKNSANNPTPALLAKLNAFKASFGL